MIPPTAGLAVGNFIWHLIKRSAAILFVLGLIWSIYVTVVRPHTKPNPSTKQEAENIVNYTYDVKPTFGCMRFNAYGKKNKEKDKVIGAKEVLPKDIIH